VGQKKKGVSAERSLKRRKNGLHFLPGSESKIKHVIRAAESKQIGSRRLSIEREDKGANRRQDGRCTQEEGYQFSQRKAEIVSKDLCLSRRIGLNIELHNQEEGVQYELTEGRRATRN